MNTAQHRVPPGHTARATPEQPPQHGISPWPQPEVGCQATKPRDRETNALPRRSGHGRNQPTRCKPRGGGRRVRLRRRRQGPSRSDGRAGAPGQGSGSDCSYTDWPPACTRCWRSAARYRSNAARGTCGSTGWTRLTRRSTAWLPAHLWIHVGRCADTERIGGSEALPIRGCTRHPLPLDHDRSVVSWGRLPWKITAVAPSVGVGRVQVRHQTWAVASIAARGSATGRRSAE